MQPVITTGAIAEMIDLAATVHVDDAVLDYVAQLSEHTRESKDTRLGVSVRGAMALVRAIKVLAASKGRAFVLPDDVKELAQAVWAHRIVLDPEAEFSGVTGDRIIDRALADVSAPQDRQHAA